MLSWDKLHAELDEVYKLVRKFDELDKLYAELGKLHAEG